MKLWLRNEQQTQNAHIMITSLHAVFDKSLLSLNFRLVSHWTEETEKIFEWRSLIRNKIKDM